MGWVLLAPLCLILFSATGWAEEVGFGDAEFAELELDFDASELEEEEQETAGLLGKRYLEVGYQVRRAVAETLLYQAQVADLQEGIGLELSLPLSRNLEWKITYAQRQFEGQEIHKENYSYDASPIPSAYLPDSSLVIDAYNKEEAFGSLIIYQFRPDRVVNPFFGAGLSIQAYDSITQYSSLKHVDTLSTTGQREPADLYYKSKRQSELFTITTGIEFTITNTLAVQTYLSTGDTFNKPEIEKIMTDYVTYHVDSTWNIGKKFYLGAGISSDFRDSDVALAFVTGRTF